MVQRSKEWLVLCFVVVGVWFSLDRSSITVETEDLKTCSQWDESSVLSNRCIRSLVPTLSTDDIENRISFLIPKEMISLHDVGVSQWSSLVLFPSIEYEIVRRCVLEGEEHPYCDSAKREEHHRLVDKKLIFMMASKNEEVQHRGMILACERSKKGRILKIPEDSPVRVRSVILYTQLCVESIEKRKEIIQSALADDSLRSMALLSIILNRDMNVAVNVADTWKPLEKSFVQGIQE